MSDAPPDPKAPAAGEGLEYDFYRFYMLIALLVLSGSITLAASPAADRVSGWVPLTAVLLSIAAATVSFACQIEIVRIATERQSERKVTRYGMSVLAGFFVVAMAMFLLVAWQLA